MSRVPFQFLMVPVGGWAPTNVPLGLVERVVYAAYHDRYRTGQREISFRSGELEAITGVAFRTACTARSALVEAGLLRVVRKGGGRGKPSAFAIVENHAPAARIDARGDVETLHGSHVSDSGNGASVAGFTADKRAANHARNVWNGPRKRAETPPQTMQNRLADQIRDHARAREGELGASTLAVAEPDQTAENRAAETVKDAQGIARGRGTPLRAGAPPLGPSPIRVVHIESGFAMTVSAAEWESDQARPTELQRFVMDGA